MEIIAAGLEAVGRAIAAVDRISLHCGPWH